MIRQRRATSHSSRKRCACSLNKRDVPLPSHDFSLPGYDIIRGDRLQGKGGGVALLFKRPIVYSETITSLSHNEFVIARVQFSSNYSIILMSVYCPPGVTHSPQLFQEALLKERSAIIMGDFAAGGRLSLCTLPALHRVHVTFQTSVPGLQINKLHSNAHS